MGTVYFVSGSTTIVLIICGFLSYFSYGDCWVWIAWTAFALSYIAAYSAWMIRGTLIALLLYIPGTLALVLIPEFGFEDFATSEEPAINSAIEETIDTPK